MNDEDARAWAIAMYEKHKDDPPPGEGPRKYSSVDAILLSLRRPPQGQVPQRWILHAPDGSRWTFWYEDKAREQLLKLFPELA